MDILTNEQVEKLVKEYDYFENEDHYVNKMLNHFPLSEAELRMIFRLFHRGYLTWS